MEFLVQDDSLFRVRIQPLVAKLNQLIVWKGNVELGAQVLHQNDNLTENLVEGKRIIS